MAVEATDERTRKAHLVAAGEATSRRAVVDRLVEGREGRGRSDPEDEGDGQEDAVAVGQRGGSAVEVKRGLHDGNEHVVQPAEEGRDESNSEEDAGEDDG